MDLSEIINDDPAARILRRLQAIAELRPGGVVQIELVRNANGEVIDVLDATITEEGGGHVQGQLQRRARYDALAAILEPDAIRARAATADERRTGRRTAVCFFDIDRFTQLNETLGRAAGDEVLRVATERLNEAVRDGDFVLHIRDDEIVVVLSGLHGVDDAIAVAEILRATVAKPIDLPSGPIDVTLSVGVTLVTDGESTDAVLTRADAAVQQAKDAGRNRVFVIGP